MVSPLDRYRALTPRSAALSKRASKTLPRGVESNFRYYDPYPLYLAHASGARVRDVDGREYLDFALCFGALMAGHAHPKVAEAIARQARTGTLFGMPHELMVELAEELAARYPVDQFRFTNSGTEATMHAMRTARGFTGRPLVAKFEGAYHGAHDAALVSVKPQAGVSGAVDAPLSVPASAGIPREIVRRTVAATFNDLDSVRELFDHNRAQIAALIVEPVMMNIGVCQPEEGFLAGLAAICAEHGSLLIFDEVKTGAKLAPGGACEYYGIKPDLVCLAKSFGGGVPIGAFGGRREVMEAISSFEVFHAGTYNASPLCVAAALATLREVLTPDVYPRIRALNRQLIDGYTRLIRETDLPAHAVGVGANGCIYFCREPVRNYRDFMKVDRDLFWRYWYGMLNRGVIPGGQYYDEQWTISVAHTEADIHTHLAAFAEVARELMAAG